MLSRICGSPLVCWNVLAVYEIAVIRSSLFRKRC